MEQKIGSLSERVEKCVNTLSELDIKSAKHLFCLTYREYNGKSRTATNRINNLYYGKLQDLEFTEKLEDFVEQMKKTFKK